MELGRRLNDKYRLERRIGAGGMAEVYLATALGPAGFERRVVLKKILPHLSSDPRFVSYFIGEAKIAAALDHENIVRVFDFISEGDELVLIMEYVDGCDLAHMTNLAFASGRPFPLNLAMLIGRKILRGLEYAHTRVDRQGNPLRIVHRDVTPRNVLLGRSGEVKVADFGIARSKSLNAATHTGMLKGKISYMSPEQARGEEVDFRSDVYSAALLLWEVLTGCRAFNASSEIELLEKVRNPDLPAAGALRPDVPEGLDQALSRALNARVEDRCPDAASFERALAEVVDQHGLGQEDSELAAYVSGMLDSAAASEISGRKTLTFIGREGSGAITPPSERRKPSWSRLPRQAAVVLGIAILAAAAGFALKIVGEARPHPEQAAAPMQATPAAAGVATLTVLTEPPGALVLLDGAPIGVAPIDSVALAPGKRMLVEAVKPGCLPQSTKATLSAGKNRTIRFKLPGSRSRNFVPEEQENRTGL